MTDLLRAADHALFLRINGVWTHPALDMAMPAMTDLNRSYWFWAALGCGLVAWLYKRRASALRMAVTLGATIGGTDLLCDRLLKPLFHRLRPEFVESAVILRAGSHSRYGFPSNHSANSFAAAAFIASLHPRFAAPAFAAAALIAYSRVYVGAHFPSDVLGGAVVGSAVGWLAAAALRKWSRRTPC